MRRNSKRIYTVLSVLCTTLILFVETTDACINVDRSDPIGAATLLRDFIHLGWSSHLREVTTGVMYDSFFSEATDRFNFGFLRRLQPMIAQAGFFPQEAHLVRVEHSADPQVQVDQYLFVSEAIKRNRPIFRFEVICYANVGASPRILRGTTYPRFEECRVSRAYVYTPTGSLVSWTDL